jgi:hypothetical protein
MNLRLRNFAVRHATHLIGVGWHSYVVPTFRSAQLGRSFCEPGQAASANQLDGAGNRIYRPVTAYAMRDPLRRSSPPSPG